MNPSVGKYIILVGLALVVVGALIYLLGDKFNWLGLFRLGRMPGDVRITGKDGGGFYFPIVTCIVVSILLNVIIALVRRFF